MKRFVTYYASLSQIKTSESYQNDQRRPTFAKIPK